MDVFHEFDDKAATTGIMEEGNESIYSTSASVSEAEPSYLSTIRWQDLPEIPLSHELNPDWERETEEINARIPINDITRPYMSKDHYLETHYRLQREAAITNLRYSVREYRLDRDMIDSESTHVYTQVFVLGYLMTQLGPACRVQFSTEKSQKRIIWPRSRRLMASSLVVVSTAADAFRTICKPAVIADRYITGGLDQNPPTIQIFWARAEDAVLDPNEELVILESKIGFFEANRHCLAGLQQVSKNNSPLHKYLVSGSTCDRMPTFVRDSPEMNLCSLLHQLPADAAQKQAITEKYRKYDITKSDCSDIRKYSSLDESQVQAVHRFLSKELAIIQGPPGTGKTFTSVQALRIMLESRPAQVGDQPVIIVAAETNHAVDQILLHLVQLGHKVVRLGGRTRDEEIKKLNMYNTRRSQPYTRAGDQRKITAQRKVQTEELRRLLAHVYPKELLDPEVLYEYGIITEDQLESLVSDDDIWTASPEPDMPSGWVAEWLGPALVATNRLRVNPRLFEDEEIDEDVDPVEFDPELDDFGTGDVDDDDGRIRGDWVPLTQTWTGRNDNRYRENSLLFRRQIKKQNLWEVDPKFRGAIYEHWQRQLAEKRGNEIRETLAGSMRIASEAKAVRCRGDIVCIKKLKIQVVGCTTTGLSKYRSLIGQLAPQTLLVEEAAQSREAVITAALYDSIQQLVLVGDHQQLVPNCDTVDLANPPYNLAVSMFQRLVSSLEHPLPFSILTRQRRMVPEIRKILNPFYPTLDDNPLVLDPNNRPPVPGMPLRSFIFNHYWPEATDPESWSAYNMQEATMVVALLRYLVLNGTEPEKITVLTFYRGQCKKLNMLCRRELGSLGIASFNIKTVDSYQGEENDIVVLSLVRSTNPGEQGRSGFVQDIHRGVVSISRARRAFYIIGNIDNLTRAGRESMIMWSTVREQFEMAGRYFSLPERGFPVACQKHGDIREIKEPDALQFSLGGCNQPCGGKFEPCGHLCNRRCHPMPHEELICQSPCDRKLRCEHGCPEVCGNHCRCPFKCEESQHVVEPLANIANIRSPPPDPENRSRNLPNFKKAGRNGNSGPSPNPEESKQRWVNFDATVEDARPLQDDLLIDHPSDATRMTILDQHRPINVGENGRQMTSTQLIKHEYKTIIHPQPKLATTIPPKLLRNETTKASSKPKSVNNSRSAQRKNKFPKEKHSNSLPIRQRNSSRSGFRDSPQQQLRSRFTLPAQDQPEWEMPFEDQPEPQPVVPKSIPNVPSNDEEEELLIEF